MMNKTWHEAHRMPKNPTQEERITWHTKHQEHCSCRPIPQKLQEVIRQTNNMNEKKYNIGSVLLSGEVIADRLREIALQIAKEYTKPFLIVSILKGACMVTTDFQRALFDAGVTTVELSFVTIKSYIKTESSKNPQFIYMGDFNPQGKQILIIDDIIDTGFTLQFLHNYLQEQGAVVRSFALLSKPERREVSYEADYVGFSIPNVWVEGYGMDTEEKGRGNPNIIVVEKDSGLV